MQVVLSEKYRLCFVILDYLCYVFPFICCTDLVLYIMEICDLYTINNKSFYVIFASFRIPQIVVTSCRTQ